MTLPANFPFPFKTNSGLHGDMLFFEVSDDHQMTTIEPVYCGDVVSFHYFCHDSDEGEVRITYRTICGNDAGSPEAEGYDIEISTGSDVWGLEETATAVRDAVALHKALGLDQRFGR